MKLTQFNKINKLTQSATYRITCDWSFLKEQLKHYRKPSIGAGLNLDPDFQRGHVWTEAQQTAYIEYVLKGGMSGREIYLNCIGWNDNYVGPFVIVDGKQRIQAVLQFLDNKIPAFGSFYSEFTDKLPREAYFDININNLSSRIDVLQWYLDLNTGGALHSAKEINRVKDLIDQEYNKL